MVARITRRRGLQFAGTGLLLAACQTTEQPTEPLQSALDDEAAPPDINGLMTVETRNPKETDSNNQGYTPQFFAGSGGSFIEIGFSLHCGGTRRWFQNNGKQLASDLKNGRRRALFSHIIRSSNELAVGVELMRVGQQRYSEAVFASLGLSSGLKRSISAREIRKFLTELGFTPNAGFSEDLSKIALLGVQRVYRDGLSITQTPYVKE